MKKLVKIALTLMLIAGFGTSASAQGMSFTEAGHPYENAVLKNIRIGDDFEEACLKFQYLVKQYDPNIKVITDKNSCGTRSEFLELGVYTFFGVTADDDGVSMITIPMKVLGYDFDHNYTKIKKTAQDYLGSPNCMTPKLNAYEQYNKFEKRYDLWFYGYNPAGTVRLDLNYMYISIYKVNKGNF